MGPMKAIDLPQVWLDPSLRVWLGLKIDNDKGVFHKVLCF